MTRHSQEIPMALRALGLLGALVCSLPAQVILDDTFDGPDPAYVEGPVAGQNGWGSTGEVAGKVPQIISDAACFSPPNCLEIVPDGGETFVITKAVPQAVAQPRLVKVSLYVQMPSIINTGAPNSTLQFFEATDPGSAPPFFDLQFVLADGGANRVFSLGIAPVTNPDFDPGDPNTLDRLFAWKNFSRLNFNTNEWKKIDVWLDFGLNQFALALDDELVREWERFSTPAPTFSRTFGNELLWLPLPAAAEQIGRITLGSSKKFAFVGNAWVDSIVIEIPTCEQ